jgi:hypothetical protein
MDHYEADEAWAPKEVVLEEALGCPAEEPSFGAGASGTAPTQPEVLARLPDLDAVEPSPEPGAKSARSDGRLLSQGLSTKLVLGGGLLLILAAVYPFVLKNSEPKPGTPPAPGAPQAPIWKGQAAETPGTLPAPASLSYEPKMSFDPELPPTPDFITAAQAPAQNASPQKPPADDKDQTGKTGDRGRAPPAQHQSRADLPRPQAHANRSMRISGLAPTAGVYANGYRRDEPADSQASRPTRDRASSIPHRAVQPGVARLEGVIEKPSVRTSYDAARSSTY